MPAFIDAWAPLVALRPQLLVRGYRLGTLIDEVSRPPRFETYSTDDLGIDIEVDAGTWTIRVKPAPLRGPRPGKDGEPLEVWARCLGEPVPATDARSLPDQLAWLRSLLPAIEAACVSSERRGTRRCLKSAAAATRRPGR